MFKKVNFRTADGRDHLSELRRKVRNVSCGNVYTRRNPRRSDNANWNTADKMVKYEISLKIIRSENGSGSEKERPPVQAELLHGMEGHKYIEKTRKTQTWSEME